MSTRSQAPEVEASGADSAETQRLESVAEAQAADKSALTGRATVVAVLFLILITLLAVIGPFLAPETYAGYDHANGALHPQLSWRYLLGTDVYGHSILTYVLLGARTSYGLAAVASAISLCLGSAVGFVAGLAGGWADRLAGMLIEVIRTIPMFALLLVLVAFTAHGDPWKIVIIFGLVGSAVAADIVQRQCRVIRRSLCDEPGAGRLFAWRLLARDSVPHLAACLVRAATTLLATFIGVGATLDFLGVGLPANDPSWGTALQTSLAYVNGGFWWWFCFPGLALFTTIVAVNLAGKGLVLALAPRSGRPPGTD